MPRKRDLITDNINLLSRIDSIIAGLDDRQYSAAPGQLLESGIGGHVRHCLDFYDCFLNGLAAGRINYDKRERNSDTELQRESAAGRIARITESLNSIDTASLERTCDVILEGGARSGQPSCRSSFGREMQFLISHTVHHYAIVAVLLKLLGGEVPPDFGTAPSTLLHRSGNKAAECAETNGSG
jgi:uncharacterized damage-inducible protein DinB